MLKQKIKTYSQFPFAKRASGLDLKLAKLEPGIGNKLYQSPHGIVINLGLLLTFRALMSYF